ncbi:MAG: FAD binding domain-containing protein [Deltaproteobacteria bacterium]|nr:FAD binding domain-containing protein [Deltaproteobacteria bacterium]
MLRLPAFDVAAPRDLPGALHLLADPNQGARPLAGGTDLVPNAKLGQTRLGTAVLLRNVGGLCGLERRGDHVWIGAGTTLAELATDPTILETCAALGRAAARVASPQIRNMATLGGNLCLDTRCRYINQSEFWRSALGGCLKSHGSECHVVPGGQGCVAALSSDTAPVLIAYGAVVEVAGWRDGQVARRELPLADLYDSDGTRHVRLAPGELLTSVRVPVPGPHVRVGHRKWAVRKSIDFPLISVALRLELAGGALVGGRLVVGVLGPRPRVLDLKGLAGRPMGAAFAAELGRMAFDRCRPLPNIPYDADYRRERLAVEVRRLALGLLDDPPHCSDA